MGVNCVKSTRVTSVVLIHTQVLLATRGFAERNERASEASERSVAEHLCYPACVLLVVSKFHTRTYVSKMSTENFFFYVS